MSQRTDGIYSVLSIACLYRLVQRIVGAEKARRIVVRDYLKPRSGETVLDIGCGPADILTHFPPVHYYGFDLSPAYIETARRRFAGRGEFYSRNVTEIQPSDLPEFDLIIMISLLHHLNDEEAAKLLSNLRPRLKTTGRLISVDPCRIANQNPIAKFLINNDRGQNIRTSAEYQALAAQAFTYVKATVRNDLLNVPYSHAIIQCTFNFVAENSDESPLS
jgi:SAM-dependent methyltransferase